MVLESGFDVAAYVSTPVGPRVHKPVVMDDALVTDLRFMQAALKDTGLWLSYVLVTPTHKDARLTAFLTTWAYEQLWMADTLGSLLVEEPEVTQPVTYSAGRSRARWHVGPLGEAIMANLYGEALTAVQMTERVADGLLLDAMLNALIPRVPAEARKALTQVRIALARQQQFFVEEATVRLGASRFARRLTRYRLRRRVFPLGSTSANHELRVAVFDDVFKPYAGWAARLDTQLEKLPGLSNLRLMRRLGAA